MSPLGRSSVNMSIEVAFRSEIENAFGFYKVLVVQGMELVRVGKPEFALESF